MTLLAGCSSPVRAMALTALLGIAAAGCSSAPGNSDPGDTLGNLNPHLSAEDVASAILAVDAFSKSVK